MRDEYHTNPSYIIPTQSKITKGLRTKSIADQEAEISAIADYDSLIGDIGDEQKEMNKIHKFSQATKRKFTLKASPKLDENLTGYKAISVEYSLETYIRKLVSDGDVEDFYGNWGLVLSVKNKPYVYKIWYDDPPFEYYADFCIKNQNISFVPKVYGKVRTIPLTFIRDISQKNAKIKALKIEKLSSVSSWDEVTDIIFESINNNTYDNGNRNEMRGILQSSASIKELLRDYYGKLTVYGKLWVKDLMENMDKITDHGKMSKDICLPNIMKTSDNKLKITDPIYNMDDSKGIVQLLDTVNSAEFTPDKKNFMVHGKKGEVSPIFVQSKFINHTVNWFCYQIDNTWDLVFPDISDIDKLTFNQQFAILVSEKSPNDLKMAIAQIIDIDNAKLVTDKYLKDIANGYLEKAKRQ